MHRIDITLFLTFFSFPPHPLLNPQPQQKTNNPAAAAAAAAPGGGMWTPSSSFSRHPKTMDEVWKDITLASDHHAGIILQDFFSKDPSPAAVSSSSPPPTLLTLSSAHPIPAFEALPNPDNNARKRFIESSGDRRHKRMIKNRESAARSRARKQAYTNELELEVAHLLEENARLRQEQQQLHRAAAAQNDEKRRPLHRTSTAPF